MSLVTDSIRLSNTEKEEHELDQLQFGSFPALKLGKLAVNKDYNSIYRGIGSLMIELARGFAHRINNSGVACKFLTLDADVENDPNVIAFYNKNGFKSNESYTKRTRTISMTTYLW